MSEQTNPTPTAEEQIAEAAEEPTEAEIQQVLIYDKRYLAIAFIKNAHAAIGEAEALQARVKPWLLKCFGEEIANDETERCHRFIEESLELVQACGATRSECHQLVDYVFDREPGEQGQEIGGVMVTLAALSLAIGFDMHRCGEAELKRIWGKVEQIRQKQANKPKHSPLPQAQDSTLALQAQVRELRKGLSNVLELCRETHSQWITYRRAKSLLESQSPAVEAGKPVASEPTADASGEAEKQYARRDIEDDSLCELYMIHLEAMTAEGLHGKADIAWELAYRDKQIDALTKFKAYVHNRLDEMGIITHPDGPHSKEGCRVGDRLDIVAAALAQLAEAKKLAEKARTDDGLRMFLLHPIPRKAHPPPRRRRQGGNVKKNLHEKAVNLVRGGVSCVQAAVLCDCSITSIRNWCLNRGVALVLEGRGRPTGSTFPVELRKRASELVKSGKSLEDVATELDVSCQTASKFCKEFGINPRRQFANRRMGIRAEWALNADWNQNNCAIARLHGISPQRVQQVRKRLGVQS